MRPVLTFQHTPDLVSDGAGNAIVAWSDYASNVASDIYAMQVRAAATVTKCQGNLCGSRTYGFERRNGASAAPRVSATCP